MKPFRYTLVADGPSDRCLLPIINFVLGSVTGVAEAGFVSAFAEPSLVAGGAGGLAARMLRACTLYPCDVLFVHRDAEREERVRRVEEISRAATEAELRTVVGVVPVRMTEAWLLISEAAIRRAADNPNGTVHLQLPRLSDLETVPDPKALLFDLLTRASEKSGRRLQQFRTVPNLGHRRSRLATIIEDFSPLEQLSAFRAFRDDTHAVLAEWEGSRDGSG